LAGTASDRVGANVYAPLLVPDEAMNVWPAPVRVTGVLVMLVVASEPAPAVTALLTIDI
jgi:hypothetical protein